MCILVAVRHISGTALYSRTTCQIYCAWASAWRGALQAEEDGPISVVLCRVVPEATMAMVQGRLRHVVTSQVLLVLSVPAARSFAVSVGNTAPG